MEQFEKTAKTAVYGALMVIIKSRFLKSSSVGTSKNIKFGVPNDPCKILKDLKIRLFFPENRNFHLDPDLVSKN